MAHLNFPINKCAEFSSFGETTFLWEWNSISSLKVGENFTKDFPVKKKSKGILKLTQIKIKENSLVKFSAGGSRSIYKGIPL